MTRVAYTGRTLAPGSYTRGTSALAGAYASATIVGGTYYPSNGAYTGGVTGRPSYISGTVAGAAYTRTISSGLAYTSGSISGGVTTVSGGNYSSAPSYGSMSEWLVLMGIGQVFWEEQSSDIETYIWTFFRSIFCLNSFSMVFQQ